MRHRSNSHSTPQPRWSSQWIWPSRFQHANARVLFRRDVHMDDPSGVKLHIAAESFAHVWINGQSVGRTTSISYPGQHFYETWEIGAALQRGENQIAILVRYIGIPSGFSCPKDPGLVCELVDSAGREVLVTDAQWRAWTLDAWADQQRRSHWFNLDQVEILDHRRLPGGWPMVALDHDAGRTPEAIPVPGVRFNRVEPRPFPSLVHEPREALSVERAGVVDDRSEDHEVPALAVSAEPIETHPGERVGFPGGFTVTPLHAGKAFAVILRLDEYDKGRLIFDVDAPAGAVVDLSWTEALNSAGHFDVRQRGVYTTDRHILAEGPNHIEPADWLCGRFLQLTFRHFDQPIEVTNLHWQREAYPLETKSHFDSTDAQLNRIVEIGLNSARLCMHDNLMDCPWRERRQWIGDAQRIALVNHYAFGDRALVRGVLRQHAQLQETSGRMWVCLPLYEEYPTQSMEWLRAVVEYERYTGDNTLREELTPNIELLHHWFADRRDAAGLFFNPNPPVVNWMDNPFGRIRGHQFETAFAAQNLRYPLFLDDVAYCAEAGGNQVLAEETRAMRRDLVPRVHEAFFEHETGLLRDCAEPSIDRTYSELTHALALINDLPGAEAMWDRWQQFAGDEPGRVILAGPFGKYWTHEALGRLNRPEQLVEDIKRHWGPMVDAGSDTAWEHFEQKGSPCHGWAGIPLVSLMRHVLEADPTTPGQSTAENLAGIDSLRVRVE